MMHTQITIFGATGFVGKQLVEQALNRGYNIKILARSKDKLGKLSDKVEVIEGDYFDLEKIDEAIEGSSIILSTIGPPLKVKNIDPTQYHLALKHLLNRMSSNGIAKLINISGAGIPYPNEKLSFSRRMLRLMLKLMAKQMIAVKDIELEMLYNSKVNFISIRPPMITSSNSEYQTHETAFVGMKVGVNQVCNFMLDNIDDDTWNRKAPLIANK